MAIVGLLIWWYTDGWKQAALHQRARLVSLFDYFSIDLLIRTLFSPFRQISAGAVDGPIAIKLRVFADRMVSRAVGVVVRSIVMVIGVVSISLAALIGLASLVGWLFVPVLPIIGLVVALLGWTPWSII